jgi:hypothetical protein
MRSSVIRLHHPTAVRTAAFSCSQACPVHAVVGLDNGCLYRSVAVTIITHCAYPFSLGMTSRWVQKDNLTVCPWRTRVPFSHSIGVLQREVPLVLADGLPVARWIEQSKCGTLQIPTSSVHRPIRSQHSSPYVEFGGVPGMSANLPSRQMRSLAQVQCQTSLTLAQSWMLTWRSPR